MNCPFVDVITGMTSRLNVGMHEYQHKRRECDEGKCRLWTVAYTTENMRIEDCSFVIMARKNADGQVVV